VLLFDRGTGEADLCQVSLGSLSAPFIDPMVYLGTGRRELSLHPLTIGGQDGIKHSGSGIEDIVTRHYIGNECRAKENIIFHWKYPYSDSSQIQEISATGTLGYK